MAKAYYKTAAIGDLIPPRTGRSQSARCGRMGADCRSYLAGWMRDFQPGGPMADEPRRRGPMKGRN